jgi:hypothetical protein
MSHPSPLHPAVDGLVDRLCEASVEASAAERALRCGNHRAAAVALRAVSERLRNCAPVVDVALWECVKRSRGGRVRLSAPGVLQLSTPKAVW